MEGSRHYEGEGAGETFAALDRAGLISPFPLSAVIGCRVDTLTILILACAFLSGVTAGAWLSALAARPRRATLARR